uniref:Uncharacterized protein n=1 Tax=Arundo donax TaxID=35708 RepID=A0A0A9EJZ9_ARUDO
MTIQQDGNSRIFFIGQIYNTMVNLRNYCLPEMRSIMRGYTRACKSKTDY